MEIIKVILTALILVASLFIITKIMGHKQVAQLDFFDYVSGITTVDFQRFATFFYRNFPLFCFSRIFSNSTVLTTDGLPHALPV